MKTIFITSGEDAALRNILRTAFYPTLRSALKETRVVLVVAARDIEKCRYEFPDFIIEGMYAGTRGLFEHVLAWVARNGLYTGTNDVMQRRAYASGESSIPPVIKRAVGKMCGKSRILQTFIRRLELVVRPTKELAQLFEKYQPAFVFCTIINNSEIDLPVLREAKRRAIPTAGMVRSWDNLTGFGFLRTLPDRLFVQNEYITEIAAKLHFLPKARTVVVGLPHYDHYLDPTLRISREAFLRQYNIDPSKKIVLYAAAGDFLFPKEGEMAGVLDELIETKAIPADAHVIYRPHPAFPMSVEHVRRLRHVVADDGKGAFLEETTALGERAATMGQFAHLINSLYHADVVVTAGSTMMIDAAAFDKPVITVAFDGVSGEQNRWFSVARFYDYFSHIKLLLTRTKGVTLVRSKEELARAINEYLQNPAKDKEGRREIIRQFVAPYDGKSGERLAHELLHEMSEF